ncbi:putative late blight resistance protein homolog R1A-10 [Salvia miltiorrhiza]|uniref:putative late blight resistance protein homolog R1A-10 n=1 Tax=Salvia miltiorrhiza TaxID=226208 RepID=UPI0025AD3673|nr:putative late blight resistance protein homolog R1A-10 [Salvia miltiorrhiza]
MAAYAALVSLARTTELLLNSDKYSIPVDEKAQITSIREYAMFLISSLEDFPERSSRLEGKIKDIANQTEVLIEYFMWKQIRLNWCSVQNLSRSEFDELLTKSREEIGLIVSQTMDGQFVGDSSATISPARLAPTNNNDVVIGLGADLITIKDRLCGASSKLQVIPITGMGGIGKTTLARNAYDDSSIVGYFHIRAWVTVSQHYSAHRILSTLLDSMTLFLKEQVLGEEIDETVMAEKVYKCLKGRRYLVVMDDVWSTEVLDDVRKLFPDDGNGSRIMLTTRLSNVGLYADSSGPLHQMRFMDNNQSWDLLKQKVFMSGQDCPSELEDIGKMIARCCGGLPLAVVLVGGILSAGKMTQASWKEVAQNIASIVDEQLEKLLSLCYKHLPQHLRPCFLLIGGFSEDYEIQVSRLIKLWVAEGFLKCGNRYKSFEDEAEEYLEDLVRRNLVLVAERKASGKIKRCKLHDLVRDLCVRKSNDVNEKYTTAFIKDFRYINHIDHYPKETWLPTFLAMLSQRVATSLQPDLVGNFRLLRILDVINDSDRLLPSQVFELFHLRYFALAYYVKIPPSISNLENLQTLIICPWRKYGRYPAHFSSLPLEIWSMPQLRHLVFSYSYILPDPKDCSTPPLENLQTLSGVSSLVCSRRVMKLLPNLKKLGIIYSRNEDYNVYNLIHLHQLEKLKITRCRDSSWLRKNPIFPLSLKKLTLYGGEFPWKDMAVVGALPNLEVLKLRFLVYDGDTWETTNGGFLQLKFLLIEESNLQYWITETNHFPRLKSLRLHYCWDLSRIPDGIGEIPTLELIEVDDVNKSLVDSAKQILEDQLEYYGNNALQVHCIRV